MELQLNYINGDFFPKGKFDTGMEVIEFTGDKEYTPDPKTLWRANEVMIFGSNTLGEHNGGAAAFAETRLGAKRGQGEGRTSQNTYALPTLDWSIPPKYDENGQIDLRVSHKALTSSLITLKEYMKQNPSDKFYMTKIGLGIGGWRLADVHKAFWDSGIPLECANCVYPMEFEINNWD